MAPQLHVVEGGLQSTVVARYMHAKCTAFLVERVGAADHAALARCQPASSPSEFAGERSTNIMMHQTQPLVKSVVSGVAARPGR